MLFNPPIKWKGVQAKVCCHLSFFSPRSWCQNSAPVCRGPVSLSWARLVNSIYWTPTRSVSHSALAPVRVALSRLWWRRSGSYPAQQGRDLQVRTPPAQPPARSCHFTGETVGSSCRAAHSQYACVGIWTLGSVLFFLFFRFAILSEMALNLNPSVNKGWYSLLTLCREGWILLVTSR